MFLSPSLPYPSIILSRRIASFYKRNELIQPPHPFNSLPLPSTILSRGEHIARLAPARAFILSPVQPPPACERRKIGAAGTTGQDEMRERVVVVLSNFLHLARVFYADIPLPPWFNFSLSLSFCPSSSLFHLPHRSTSTLYSTRVCRAIYFRICHSVYCFLPLVYSK